MDLEGFEPSTSSVRLKRAPNCATGPLAKGKFHFTILRMRVKKRRLSFLLGRGVRARERWLPLLALLVRGVHVQDQ